MSGSVIILFRSCIVLIFGLAVSLLFAGVKRTRESEKAIAVFFLLLCLIQVACWQLFGLQVTMKLYPFITHLPVILFLILYCKRPPLISISSVLTAYLSCQIPKWIGSVTAAVTGKYFTEHLAYLVTMCIVYFLIKKYVADSVIQLTSRSKRTCLVFSSVPFLYYLFDYATTVYTELLYTGARVVVQFTPTLICTFYLIFTLLYYNESKKQMEAQRERDIFASQFQNAKVELEAMQQMQNNTMIYRHDMRHHLSLIGSYASDGDLEKIKEYLAGTEAAIDALTPVRYCENETVNLVLSSFVSKAAKKQVALHIDVKLPENLGINDTELCALLSNALENAISAVDRVDDDKLRKVFFRAVISNDKLVISTENAYTGTVEMDGDLPKSNNSDDGHGFGIKSIVDIVNRHGGLYSFETEGGVFIMRLMLPQTPRSFPAG